MNKYKGIIKAFISDTYVINQDFQISISDFYNHLVSWTFATGFELPSKKMTSLIMYELGFKQYRTNKQRYYKGHCVIRDNKGYIPTIIQYCLIY